MARKNDYSVIIFSNGKPYKYNYVHNLNKFTSFVYSRYPQWSAMNVYNRRTGEFLKQFRPGQSVPNFLF